MDWDTFTEAQGDRRRRIIDASIAIAATGGYDAVHMRTVASRAKVAIGTVYRHFPTKDELLVIALQQSLDNFRVQIAPTLQTMNGPYQRLRHLFHTIIDDMDRQSLLANAFARSFMRGYTSRDVSAASQEQLTELLASAFHSDRTLEISTAAEVLADVWTAAILAFAQGRASLADIRSRAENAVSVLEHRRHVHA